MATDDTHDTPKQEASFHTYTTHSIPWYVRAMWILFWVGLIWYVVQFAIPAARDYF
ncbi:MAG: hypothetical protein ACYTHJ_08935 [Planctomycetota bacterium]|jgi:hypothetical protein